MTPYEIDVMLHYYTRVNDHECVVTNPPVWRGTVEAFLELGLLALAVQPSDVCYRITERGKAYCGHLCAVQVPVCKWVQPEPSNG